MKKEKKRYLTKQDIQNLNYVRVRNPKVKFDNFPDFLIIGPQRTGTTWLHRNLAKNPEIFMSEPKEIHYFAILCGRANKNIRNDFRPDISYYLNHFNENKISSAKDLLKFFMKKKKLSQIKARGESSATYALLNSKAINDILTINPDIKIMMLVRNPIERVWSHFKLEMIQNPGIGYSKKNKYKNVSEIPEENILKFINKKPVIENSFFSKIIDKWSSMLKEGNLFIGNFKDIADCPGDLLMRIHNFLELNFDESLFEKLMRKKINKSKDDEIPQKIRFFLEQRYNDEIKLLRGKYKIEV